jgi:hypothetical protein
MVPPRANRSRIVADCRPLSPEFDPTDRRRRVPDGDKQQWERFPKEPRLEDVAEAGAAIERLAAAPADGGLVIREIWLLRLRALVARAHGDASAYAHFRDRYRDTATSLGFEGHIAWAEAVP